MYTPSPAIYSGEESDEETESMDLRGFIGQRVFVAGRRAGKTTMALSLYGEGETGHTYGPGEMHHFNPGGSSMKACHACGQKLPLKQGDIVEGKHEGKAFTGMVVHAASVGRWVDVTTFDGRKLLAHVPGLTRLHGYYRITERETL